MGYSKTQLNVDVVLPLSIKFEECSQIVKAEQLFPDMEELKHMYIVSCKKEDYDTVYKFLSSHSGIESVGKVAIRQLI